MPWIDQAVYIGSGVPGDDVVVPDPRAYNPWASTAFMMILLPRPTGCSELATLGKRSIWPMSISISEAATPMASNTMRPTGPVHLSGMSRVADIFSRLASIPHMPGRGIRPKKQRL